MTTTQTKKIKTAVPLHKKAATLAKQLTKAYNNDDQVAFDKIAFAAEEADPQALRVAKVLMSEDLGYNVRGMFCPKPRPDSKSQHER